MGVRKSKASPSRGGGTAIAVTERSYQICGNLSVTFGDSSPGRGAFPRKKVTSIWISNVPSIDGRYSTATSCKLDAPVSGGAYQDAREVTSEWNDIQKLGACLKSEAESTKRIQAPFSPLSFPAQGKR